MILNEITKSIVNHMCILPISLFPDIIQQILPKSPVVPLRRYACARPCVRKIQIGRTDRPQRSAADTPAGSLIRLTWFWTLFFLPRLCRKAKKERLASISLQGIEILAFLLYHIARKFQVFFSSPIPIIYSRRLRSERNVRWRRAGAQEGRQPAVSTLLCISPFP